MTGIVTEYFWEDRPIKVCIEVLNPPWRRDDLTNCGYLTLRREKHMNSLQIFNIATKRNDLVFEFKMNRKEVTRLNCSRDDSGWIKGGKKPHFTGRDCEALKYAAWKSCRGLTEHRPASVRKDTGMTDLAMGQENEQDHLLRALPILITWCSETQCGFSATVTALIKAWRMHH